MDVANSPPPVGRTKFVPKFTVYHQSYLRSHWSHELYGSAEGRVRLHYSTDGNKSDELARMLGSENVLGFVMYWHTEVSNIDYNEMPDVGDDNIALIALASEQHICIFHLNLDNANASHVVVQRLQDILENPNITKVGIGGCGEKSKRLDRYGSIKAQGMVDVQQLHRSLYGSNDRGNSFESVVNRWLPLNYCRETWLGKADWRGPGLTKRGEAGVADDAYAAYQTFRLMEAESHSRNPNAAFPSPGNRYIPPIQEEAPSTLEGTAGLSTPIIENRVATDAPSLDSDTMVVPEHAEAVLQQESPPNNAETGRDRPDFNLILGALQKTRDSIMKERKIADQNVIAHDNSLVKMARQQPRDIESLRNLRVVSPRYADRFLKTILQNNPGTEDMYGIVLENESARLGHLGMEAFSRPATAIIESSPYAKSSHLAAHKLFTALSNIRVLVAENSAVESASVASDKLLCSVAAAFVFENQAERLRFVQRLDGWSEFSAGAGACGINVYKYLSEHVCSDTASDTSADSGKRRRLDLT